MRGTILGVPIIRTIVFGVYIGVPSFWETTMYSCIYIYTCIYTLRGFGDWGSHGE